jgi:hypothetical protein
MILGIFIFIILIFIFIILCKVGSIIRFKNNVKHIYHIAGLFKDTEKVKLHLLFDYLYIQDQLLFYKEIQRLLKEESEYFFSLAKLYCTNYENTVHFFTTLLVVSTQKILYIDYKNIIQNYLKIEVFLKYIKKQKQLLNKNQQIDNTIRNRRLDNLNVLEGKFKGVIYNGE